jgi:hypothetical protein
MNHDDIARILAAVNQLRTDLMARMDRLLAQMDNVDDAVNDSTSASLTKSPTESTPLASWIREEGIRAVSIAVVLVLHLFLTLLTMAILNVSELVWKHFFGEKEPILDGYLPLHFLYQVADGLVIVAFLVSGTYSVVRVFFGKR